MSLPDEAERLDVFPAAERLDVFMARANARYYAERDPFADFTTAPEIGQVFGELLGAWAAVTWAQMGSPDPVLLVEAGPGRGTLMADLRRATACVAPAFHAACRVHLVETSPRLRAEQAARVPDASLHAALEEVPEGPAIVLANEFLDALPIRQFVFDGAGWSERYVAAGRFVEGPMSNPDVPARFWTEASREARPGSVVEVSAAAREWVRTLATRLVRFGGAALILDYGRSTGALGDSLQAIRDGKPADPLAHPGTADLTAHVDFASLAHIARSAGAAVRGPLPQGAFLERLGLGARTARLAAANPRRTASLYQAAGRLAEPARMGDLFKALCLTHPDLPAPPGFEP